MEYLSKEEKTNLESKLRDKLNYFETITPTEDERVDFRRSVRDDNPVHADIEIAKKLNFENTPIVGTFYSALGEKIADNLLEIFWEYNSQLIQTGQKIDFIRAMYPGDKAIWEIEGYEGSLRDNNFNVNLTAKKNGKKPSINLTAKFGIQKPRDINLNGKLLYTHQFSNEDSILSEDISNFYKGIRNISLKEMANSHVTSLAPATLLKFLTKLNEKHETEYIGANQSMNSAFISQTHPGDFEVTI